MAWLPEPQGFLHSRSSENKGHSGTVQHLMDQNDFHFGWGQGSTSKALAASS